LGATEIAELTRVALAPHKAPVSKIVAIAVKMLSKHCPGVRLLISFADSNEGHHGGIYQAGNWLYCGLTSSSNKFIDRQGNVWHPRQVSVDGYKIQYGEVRKVQKIADCTKVPQLPKHRYLYPLDDDIRKQVEPLRKPYPKRQPRAGSETIDTPTVQVGKGGEAPTPALQDVI
jgi:hypothetical protein